MTLDPGLSIAKIFTSVIYEDLLKASVFVPGRSLQPSLMFSRKTRDWPTNIRLGWKGMAGISTLAY